MDNLNFAVFLKKSLDEKIVASVFTDREQSDKCSVGFVKAISENQVLLNHISPLGMYDGYVVRRLDSVFRVDIDGQYENKIKMLYSLKKQSHNEPLNRITTLEDNLFYEVLKTAKENNYIVNICSDSTQLQESVMGYVKDVSDIELVVARVNGDGQNDGESVIMLEDIDKLNCDSDEEQALKLLSEYIKASEDCPNKGAI